MKILRGKINPQTIVNFETFQQLFVNAREREERERERGQRRERKESERKRGERERDIFF